MDSPFARYHKHGTEGASSGVAKVGEASEGEAPIIPRKVHRKELLVNNFLAKSLSCSLCSDILSDPQNAGCGDGHSFCASCLSKRFGDTDSSQCPTCEKEIKKDRVSDNVQLRTLVKDLCIHCPSNLSYNCESKEYEPVTGGCGWTERFEALPGHVAECTQQTVLCPGAINGCPVFVWKWGLPAHMKSCTYTCECECGLSVAVRELERHKKVVCTRTEVGCPHEKLGCGARLLRTEMGAHLEKCDFQRLRPAFLAIEAKHAAEVANLKQEYEVTLAGERAYFEQELGRLRAQLQLATAIGGRADQRGEPKVRLSKGGFARKAQALGLATAEELQLQNTVQPQKGKRKRAPKTAANGGGSRVIALSAGLSNGGLDLQANGGGATVLAEPVDASQFVRLPQDSLFRFDQLQGGKESSTAAQTNQTSATQIQAPTETTQTLDPPLPSQPAANPGPSANPMAGKQPPRSRAKPTASVSAPPPVVINLSEQLAPRAKKAKSKLSLERPMFQLPVSQKPGFKKCPWTEGCPKSLPQNATSCPGCGKTGPKPGAPAPSLLEQKCGACGAVNPRSFVTCVQCNTYLPREYSSNRCGKCGRGNNGNARNCGKCGAELRPKRVAQYSGNMCPKCAHGNNANARKCKTCGHEMRPAPLAGRLKT